MTAYIKDKAYREALMKQARAERLEREKRNVDSRREARAANPKTAALDEVHRLLKKIIE
jgi:hypothetical protein